MHSATISNRLIGQARLTMVEIAQAGDSLTCWLPLLDDRYAILCHRGVSSAKESCKFVGEGCSSTLRDDGSGASVEVE